jgi:hypothetical protein
VDAQRTWPYLSSHSIEFGLDLLSIDTSETVTVTSVELVDAQGLRLNDVAFVAGGAVGDGFEFGNAKAATYPDAWRSRLSLPHAVLSKLNASSVPVVGTWSKFPVWQVVVGVTATGASVADSDGVRIIYQVNGKSHQVLGRARLALVKDLHDCDRGGSTT